MKKSKRILIWLFTVLLICAAALAGSKEGLADEPLYALVSSGSSSEAISVWYDDHYGTLFLFLPAHAGMEQVQLKTSRDGAYQIGGQVITDGICCGSFQLDTEYPISAAEGFPYDGKKMVFLRSGGVSTLFVDVSSGSMDYLLEDKTHDETGVVRLYGTDGTLLYSGNADSVSGRGQSSWWGEEKKPYNITLHEEADLLGLGSARKWALIANAKDSSHLRNKLVYDLADAAGIPYSPDSQWVDVYFNGEYAGLFLLCEKIEVHPNRVDIPAEGSFLVTKDLPDRLGVYMADYVSTGAGASIGVLHSDYPLEQLQTIWQRAENAMLADDGVDPVSGKQWQELIEPISWVRKFLLEEVFGNIDAPIYSQYYFRDGSLEDDRIFASPPWDYEVAMTRPVNMIHVYRKDIYGGHWNWSLYRKPEFYELVVQQYRDVFRPLLLEAAQRGLESYRIQMGPAANMNNRRWHIPTVEYGIDQVREYLTGRTAVLDSVWLEQKPYITVCLRADGGAVYAYLQEPGSVLPELESYEGVVNGGWFYQGTDIPADPQTQLWEDTTVEQRRNVQTPEPEAAEQSAEPVQEALPEQPAQPVEAEKPAPFFVWGDPIPKTRLAAPVLLLVMLGMLALADRLRFSRKGEKT